MDRSTGLIEISQRYELPIIEVYEYVNLWIDEGLAEAC